MSRFDIHVQKSLPGFRLDARLQTDAARVVIIGGSGSGKTLFMQAVAGLYPPDGGHIRIGDRAAQRSGGQPVGWGLPHH